ncbi:MAG TPA: hypothetical protein H9815_01680 [Candidatus Ruania gallistercoris]|uniref:Uncharacterized protein n=1 Tax=Candidatus Ruania gallistercoris TaxID=2838746 RepID=A0A9D2J2E6_9MICO|nr:hypothetical protein [Candidatus Ruania gallistercoris]
MPQEQTEALTGALEQVHRAQEELAERAALLEALAGELTSGVATGVLQVGQDEDGAPAPGGE